ncbi:MAG: LexA family protein [Oligosphaeraceae bacterium]
MKGDGMDGAYGGGDEVRSAWLEGRDGSLRLEPEERGTGACPCLSGVVAAGFPSPAESYAEHPLDLNELLVHRPAATFFVRACGDSMVGAGIQDGDILVVDRSLEARHGSIVIACVDGEFTVKYLHRHPQGGASLVPANPRYAPILLDGRQEVELFGVVTATIHRFAVPPHR